MKRINWFRVFIILLACYFFYLLVGQQMTLNAIQRENDEQKIKLQQMQQTNLELKQEHENLRTPAYIEKIAREELGMVKSGELPYVSGKKN